MAAQNSSEIRYLTPPSVEVKRKKYCRFKKSGIKYIDYKDPEFLKKFLNQTEISQELVDCTAATCIISTPLDALSTLMFVSLLILLVIVNRRTADNAA